jgi:hypothetical protein
MLRFMRSLTGITRLIVSRRDEQVKFKLLVYSKEKVRRKKKSLVC